MNGVEDVADGVHVLSVEDADIFMTTGSPSGIITGLEDVFSDKDFVDEINLVSGGSESEDKCCSYGYASYQGRRATMEDFYDAKISKIDGHMVGLFGVFDGHGGSRAAEYLKQHLFDNLISHPKFMTDTKLAITEIYQQTDAEFLKASSSIYRDDGSTASTAVLVGHNLYVANVGDSRAVMSKAGEGEVTQMLYSYVIICNIFISTSSCCILAWNLSISVSAQALNDFDANTNKDIVLLLVLAQSSVANISETS